jgi:hypothetical protein
MSEAEDFGCDNDHLSPRGMFIGAFVKVGGTTSLPVGV